MDIAQMFAPTGQNAGMQTPAVGSLGQILEQLVASQAAEMQYRNELARRAGPNGQLQGRAWYTSPGLPGLGGRQMQTGNFTGGGY